MINKHVMQKRFSKQAKTYDQYAHVQKKMGKRLLQQLQEIQEMQQMKSLQTEQTTQTAKSSQTMHSTQTTQSMQAKRFHPKTILEVGCGTGYLTQQLQETFPHAHITAVDIAPGMIEMAKQRGGHTASITYQCADIEDTHLEPSSYDLIISNTTFQWFNHTQQTIAKLVNALTNKGTLCFSTFGPSTFVELHDSFTKAQQELKIQTNHRLGQSFFSLEELENLCQEVVNSTRHDKRHNTRHNSRRDAVIHSHDEMYYEYFSEVRDFFTSIKKIGANNSDVASYCQRPSLFKELIKTYDALYREKEGVRATYHGLYVYVSL